MLRQLLSVECWSWGQKRRGICGVGAEYKADHVPETVKIPNEIPWFIPHAHETNNGTITLSGKVFVFGDNETFCPLNPNRKKDGLSLRFSRDREKGKENEKKTIKYGNLYTPCPCVVLNEMIKKDSDVPINICVGHGLSVVLTHKGFVYGTKDGHESESEFDGTPHWIIKPTNPIIHIACSSFKGFLLDSTNALYSIDAFSHEKKARSHSSDVRKVLKMKEGETIVSMNCGYENLSLKTSTDRVFEIGTGKVENVMEFYEDVDHEIGEKENHIREMIRELEDVKEYNDGAYHRMYCDNDGRIYGRGANISGEMLDLPRRNSNFTEMKLQFDDEQEKEDKLIKKKKRKVVGMSGGCDYTSGGHSLMLIEEEEEEQENEKGRKRVLYHCGMNKCGEHLTLARPFSGEKYDKLKRVKFLDDMEIIQYSAGENHCMVLVWKKIR